ncbi:mitochondrial fission ELM1 family protein [bacterium]|nr:mitochondrial fission ELM1 family protein [bacterium]
MGVGHPVSNSPLIIGVVHDGKAGHRSQALGILRWFGEGFVVEASWSSLWAERAGRLWVALGGSPSPVALPQRTERCDLIFSVGTASAVPALAWGRRVPCPVWSVMVPWGIPRSRFKGAVLPPHDSIGSPHEIVSLVAPSPFAYSKGARKDEVALLLGGGRHGASWPWEPLEKGILDLANRLGEKGMSFVVAPSRRTPLSSLEKMARRGVRVWSQEKSLDKLFRQVRGVVVTDDSYSLVSEAIQAGFRPRVWETGTAKKLTSVWMTLNDKGWIDRSPISGEVPHLLRGGPAPHYEELLAHIEELVGSLQERV